MALTVLFALLRWVILSLMLMPVLASLRLPRRMSEQDPWLVRLARWLYRPILHLSLRNGLVVILLALGALGVGAMLLRGLDRQFVPPLSEGAFVLNVFRLPGTS